MRHKIIVFCFAVISTSFSDSNACQIEGVANWFVPHQESIFDVQRGVVFSGATTDVIGINGVTYGEGLQQGPYLDVTLADSEFRITTNERYVNYEENETAQSMAVTVTFDCSGGVRNSLVFLFGVIDTNNNAPEFLPSDQFEFEITTPIPPGFLVTGCDNSIIVRDIDLTTQRIQFEIEDNPYFQIAADSGVTNVKQFGAILRSTTFIRSLSEPVVLQISATDVDLTGDPPRTTYATIRIEANSEFELPEEPSFTQAFYTASYTNDEIVQLDEPISLQQGYSDLVTVRLEGEFAENFNLSSNGNEFSLVVFAPLPPVALLETQIVLVVRAEREFTSGTTATLIVRLPENEPLQFERANYVGVIEDSTLQVSELIITQGYQNEGLNVNVTSEHSSYFQTRFENNAIVLTMAPLQESIISENNFINLQVTVYSDRSAATTVVTLEIIKDDDVTPVFERALYVGTYDLVTGLSVEAIVVVQGYDDTVQFNLTGEHSEYFQYQQTSPGIINIATSVLPAEILRDPQILLTLGATKPRTVGATTAISLSTPEARVLGFESNSYHGTVQDNDITLEDIVLSTGYSQDVNFTIRGDYESFFRVVSSENVVNIVLETPLPEQTIADNNMLLLNLVASGENALSTSTSVLLEIIKDDIATPVFNQNIYLATYNEAGYINVEDIIVTQGFDDTVTFKLSGAHAEYFQVNNSGRNVLITTRSEIPADVIYDLKVMVVNVLAQKPLTVGANAAISVQFPPEMTNPTVLRFTQHAYTGTLDENNLMLGNIVLSEGFGAGTTFSLGGEYSASFTLTSVDNIISISLGNQPSAEMYDNDLIILEVQAERERALSVVTSVVLDVVRAISVRPVFNAAFYRGAYTENSGLQFEEEISLSEGYDENVVFSLEGELYDNFYVTQEGNSVVLNSNGPLPETVWLENNQLLFSIVATKPDTVGRSAISIDLMKVRRVEFSEMYYRGFINSGLLTLDPIIIEDGYTETTILYLSGDHREYFQATVEDAIVTLRMDNLPEEVMASNDVLILTLQALTDGVGAHTTIIIDIIRRSSEETPIIGFDETYYVGSYSEINGLTFNQLIHVVNGTETIGVLLDGDDSQWFELTRTGNTFSLVLSSPIPPAVLANNQQLIFVVYAEQSKVIMARSTIVILLTDELTDIPHILGFERINYMGFIENDVSILTPIILVEGYTEQVNFTLHGNLENYFSLFVEGPNVMISLVNPIPEESLPTNRIIILELRAFAPDAISAYASIVFELIREEESPSFRTLQFSAPYYTGQYTVSEGLIFNNLISLSEGYDQSVQFEIEGEHAQWFALSGFGNELSLIVDTAIPSAVLANNQQLIFTVTAQGPESEATRSTIVISLPQDLENLGILGFEQVNYIGTIENNVATLEEIILVEGYTSEVVFTLHGDLAAYFSLTTSGPSVQISLPTPIPEQLLSSDRLLLLELRASAPSSITARATIVFQILEDESPALDVLQFSEPYYTGQYTEANGLVFSQVITLSEGYNELVNVTLEGENSAWFEVVVSENAYSLAINSVIPPAVIANNEHLIFTILAERSQSISARSTVFITLSDELTDIPYILGFEQINYLGSIENDVAILTPIILVEGYTEQVNFTLHGSFENYFSMLVEGPSVSILLANPIPEESLPRNRIIILELRAYAPDAISAYASIVFELVREEESPYSRILQFSAPYYTGRYTISEGLEFNNLISLSEGYDQSVNFEITGDHAQWFALSGSGNELSLILDTAIPSAVLAINQQLIFTVTAQRPESEATRSTIVISLPQDLENLGILGFEQINYVGAIENNVATLEEIILVEGYTSEVVFTLHGDLAAYFSLTTSGPSVQISLPTPIPEQLLSSDRLLLLVLRASAPSSITARATIVFQILEDESPALDVLRFSEPYYTGQYTEANGLVFSQVITLSEGYNEFVNVTLEGENSAWFEVEVSENAYSLVINTVIPPAVIANNENLIFTILAERSQSISARSTVIITLSDELTDIPYILGFEQINYLGSIENDVAILTPITLVEGYTEQVNFTLHGNFENYFSLLVEGSSVIISLANPIPEESLPTNRIIILELRAFAPDAISAYTSIVFELVREEESPSSGILQFSAPYYTGQYTVSDGLEFNNLISLSEGYDESVNFKIEGDHAQWFSLTGSGNELSLILDTAIPSDVLANNQQLIFTVTAQRPESEATRSTIVITLPQDSETTPEVAFQEVLYRGILRGEVLNHEAIIVSGYNETTITVLGEYSQLFSASATNGAVVVQVASSIPLPEDVNYVALELHAADARSVLLLSVSHIDVEPVPPTVTFSAQQYTVAVDSSRTGVVGRVQATADNGETVAYSLIVDNTHLGPRISVNADGDLILSAPAQSGVYTFKVVATTAISRVTGAAGVELTVEETTECGDNGIVVPPLIVLDRDEEEPHRDLVAINGTTQGCSYTLTNRWPIDQTWLYVDETGLHTTSIDREHSSIAHMALSQVVVEITLHCEDTQTRAKRSLNENSRLDSLGPYDYGTNKWLLGDTIPYNSRRSVVNLVVNDINDNAPVFDGKENEPIAVGYPVPELEDVVQPRALAELQATDADVGVNAALVYWSSEESLAVSHTMGSVHVRNNARVANGDILTVVATDQNGQGLSGDIQLMVRLLDINHIAVVTVRDAFLDDENAILSNVSNAIGYEVKALRSVVVSDSTEEIEANRKKRQTVSGGASLQLYVYGLIEREPVEVVQLAADISNNEIGAVNVVSTMSLEDYLEEGQTIYIIQGQSTGLLVATIVLSVLLFILIVALLIWLFLKWRKKRNYNQFSDENSITSRNESLGLPKTDNVSEKPSWPRLNIEELKRSERRLQEMLDAPLEPVKATTAKVEAVPGVIPTSVPVDQHTPIVIQSTDKLKDFTESSDDDEFGEKKSPRRKSVVTFNETVEKIIHVEDVSDSISESSGVDVYRL